MTKENAAEWVKLLQGMVDGGELQYNVGNDSNQHWVKSAGPDLNAQPRDYRIKPTPKLRPWKCAQEVPMPCIVRHKHFAEGGRWMVVAATVIGIIVGNGEGIHSNVEMLEKFEHSTDGGKTWKPCGVEE